MERGNCVEILRNGHENQFRFSSIFILSIILRCHNPETNERKTCYSNEIPDEWVRGMGSKGK